MKRAFFALIAALFSLPALAAYPEKLLTVVVGFPAGSAPEVAARLVAQKRAPRIGQAVVVENRAGAAGTIAAATVARAEPDGYTLLFGREMAIATEWLRVRFLGSCG